MSSELSLLFYLATFMASAALFWYGSKRKNKIMLWVALSMPVLLSSMRYMVGSDYGAYLQSFANLSDLSFIEYLTGTGGAEIGFFSLIKLSDTLTGGPYLLFASASFLTIVFFYLGLRRYNIKHPALVYFLYLCVLFPMTLNIVRQGIAISICFYAFSFILEKNFKKYLFWVLIASLFHVSALIMLPVYFFVYLINDKKQNAYPKLLLKTAAIGLVIYFATPMAINFITGIPFFERYDLYQAYTGEGTNYTIFLQVAILIGGVVAARWAAISRNMRLYFTLIIFATLEIVFTATGFSSTFIKRISLYFSIFSFMLLAEAASMFSGNAGKLITTSIGVLYGGIYFYVAYYMLGQSDVIPYQVILGGNQ